VLRARSRDSSWKNFTSLRIAGEISGREQILEMLKKYIRQAYFINPAGEVNRAPITQIKGITLDLITLFLKGK